MRPSTGSGRGIASFGSSTSGVWSSKLKTRKAAPSAWLSPPYEAESLARGVGRVPAAPRNAMNSPTVNPPSMTLLPPNHRTPARPKTDSNSITGVITACTFTPRIDAWKFPSFLRLNLSISWASMVKALITLIPERVSWRTVVTSAIVDWISPVIRLSLLPASPTIQMTKGIMLSVTKDSFQSK